LTKRARRNYRAFKSKVALAALKGEKTLAELAQQFDGSRQSDHSMEGAASGRAASGLKPRPVRCTDGGCEHSTARRWLRVTAKSRINRPFGPISYTTLKLSSGSSGFWSSIYCFPISSVTLPLDATQ
jgi:hypothetical protein